MCIRILQRPAVGIYTYKVGEVRTFRPTATAKDGHIGKRVVIEQNCRMGIGHNTLTIIRL